MRRAEQVLTVFFKSFAKEAWLQMERGKLLAGGHRRLVRALDGRPCPIGAEIERQRAEMLTDHSPLGAEGPYDAGQTIADACRVSRPANSARLLYSLAAEYRPRTILELGTNVGISAAYLAASGGKVTTLEASPARIELAKRLHRAVGLSVEYVAGLFADTLKPTLDSLPPVELAFIDGHHQYQPTLDYYALIAEQAAPHCVYIFDDIRWSKGMRRAWSEISRSGQWREIADLGNMGVVVA